jgi:hypothetical protein
MIGINGYIAVVVINQFQYLKIFALTRSLRSLKLTEARRNSIQTAS